VRTSVELYDDAAIEADEVDDVIPKWNLPPKLES
jgi:hypothetical protein